MSIKRRTFIKKTAMAGGAALLPNYEAESKDNRPDFKVPAKFNTIILATNWGFQGSFDEFCAKAKESGYDGIEVWLPWEEDKRKDLMRAIEKHDLQFGFLAAGSGGDFLNHFDGFKASVEAALTYEPLFVNCHSGKDFFSFENNKKIIDYSLDRSAETGIPIYHETHRGRILYSTIAAKQFLEAIPDLRLTLDISHWTNVHESMLEDQPEIIELALSRTDHIHSRVGHREGPQISDPRAPEWEPELNIHFSWWDRVLKQKLRTGATSITMTTEFGPPGYMPALPYTRQPIADLWEINTHMMKLWRERYASF